MKKCLKKGIAVFNAFLLGILLVSCSPKDDYSWGAYSLEQVETLFSENEDEFYQVCDIIVNNEDFWDNARRDDSRHAWIMSPNEEEKMKLFSEEEQAVLADFFMTTKPYMISLDDRRCIEITYINSDRTSAYEYTYYFDKTSCLTDGKTTWLEEWIHYIKANYDVFTQINDDWYFYYR